MLEAVSEEPRKDESVLFHLARWFCIDGPVSRQDYIVLGFGLALVKYLIEMCVSRWKRDHLLRKQTDGKRRFYALPFLPGFASR